MEWPVVFGEGSEWFWAMAQFIAITVSLIFIYRQIRIQSQSNMLQTFESLTNKWNSSSFIEQRREACSEYPKAGQKIGNAAGDVLGFFEDLGLCYKKGIFDIELVWERYSYFIDHYWAMYQSSINNFRTETRDNTWFCCFEELHKAILEYSNKRGANTSPIMAEQISKFIRGELNIRSSN